MDFIVFFLSILLGAAIAVIVLGSRSHGRDRESLIEPRTFGLQQIWPASCEGNDDADFDVDIVAIHGLETKSPRTWEFDADKNDPKSSVTNWLKDEHMLPLRFPKARILTYDWRADTFRNAADDYLHGHAEHMLSALQNKVGHRPLIFIGSCFGGLLLAEALVSDLMTVAMKDSIAGIITLGTPFKGTRAATAAQIRVKLAETFGGEVSEKLLEVLRGDQSSFDKTVERFARLIHDKNRKIPLKCFYETEKSDIYGRHIRLLHLPGPLCRFLGAKPIALVEKSSACIDGLEPYQVNVKHLMMNKFQTAQDPTFEEICNTINEFLLSTTRQQQIHEARAWLSSQDNRQYAEILQRRPAQIESCHSGTFEWLLVDDAHEFNKAGHMSAILSPARAAFQEWLAGKANFFWIHGKAGSGKSTMMKKVAAHRKTIEMLSHDSRQLVIIFHSFWRPGHLIQKSFLGMLFTVVIALADNNEETIAKFLSANKQLRNTSIFDWPTSCLSQLSLQLIDVKRPAADTVLFFDGLDEIDQEHDKDSLIDYLQQLRCRGCVKTCVSSRHERPWIDGFDQFDIAQAQLRLETLNKLDIHKYVNTELQKTSSHIRRLYATEELSDALVDTITYRAEGVFLWAVLVVESLRQTAAGTTTWEIQKRVSDMPKGLIGLYSHLLGKLKEDEVVLTEAASYLKLVRDFPRRLGGHRAILPHATILRQRCFAKSHGANPTRADFARSCGITMSRVRDICVGMIQFESTKSYSFETEAQLETTSFDSSTGSSTKFESSTLRALYAYRNVAMGFLHRSVSDFLQDHPEGQSLMEKSEIDDVEIFNSVVDSEITYLRLDAVEITPENPPETNDNGLLILSTRILRLHVPSATDKVRSDAIRRLICSVNASRSRPDALTVEDGDWLQIDHKVWSALLDDSSTRGPATDGPGYALAQGHSAFFNEEIVHYLQTPAAGGYRLPSEYKNYLLMCAIYGNVPEVALKLVYAGASLHARTPTWLGGPWVRFPIDELSESICHGDLGWPPMVDALQRPKWRQLMTHAQKKSHYSVFSFSFPNLRLMDSTRFLRSSPVGILIDTASLYGPMQACPDRLADAHGRWWISDPDKHVGFAINATTNAFVPIRAGFLRVVDRATHHHNFHKNQRLEGELYALVSDYAPWLFDWQEELRDGGCQALLTPQSTLAKQASKHGLLWDDWEVKLAVQERLQAEEEAQWRAQIRNS